MNPFSSLKLKHLPDVVLVASGIIFVGAFMAMLKGANLPYSPVGWVLSTGSFFSFSIGWKNAHYRALDDDTRKWANFWRNNALTNIFLGISIGLLVGAVVCFKFGS
ncbi:hypothetical protein ACPV5L_15375 [Vibrio astriarenae]|uniref:hypothetical protein n=1 Tax=Vibrio rotiferianus TaxID=190895 RepID=UPI003908BDDD